MVKLDKFLSTHNTIDASSISEEDDPRLVIKLIEKFLKANDQEENYDQIKWYKYEEDDEEDKKEDVVEISAGNCDVNIYFVIGEGKTEKYNITLNDVQFFKTTSKIIKEILEIFEKPLTSLALNTIITEEFLLDYINQQIKIIDLLQYYNNKWTLQIIKIC